MSTPVTSHRCRAIGCCKQIARGLLMCPAHWRMVPRHIRQEVWTTYKTVTRRDASSVSIAAYTAAVQKAVDAVSHMEIQRKESGK